jgi:dTDP-glucose pyrophosphorylase
VILAATCGTRLFPLTSSDDGGGVPKHLLPVSPLNPGGVGGGGGGGMSTPLGWLLSRVQGAGINVVVVAVHTDGDATVPYLLGGGSTSRWRGSRRGPECARRSRRKTATTTMMAAAERGRIQPWS